VNFIQVKRKKISKKPQEKNQIMKIMIISKVLKIIKNPQEKKVKHIN